MAKKRKWTKKKKIPHKQLFPTPTPKDSTPQFTFTLGFSFNILFKKIQFFSFFHDAEPEEIKYLS